jgi:restriction system-associated AAA family ATPase
MFQAAFHAVLELEERGEGNPDLQFELEYLIRPEGAGEYLHVRIARQADGRRKPVVLIEKMEDGEWNTCDFSDKETLALLPRKVVGYTSGDNETLSLPFLLSRSGYAEDVGRRALDETTTAETIPDTRLMLIDYGTHLEVLVANLMLGASEQRAALLSEAGLDDIFSFRCTVQLAHHAAPKAPAGRRFSSARKGVQLTEELERYLDQLRRCSTCYDHDERTDTYTFDFFADEQSRAGFRHFWDSALSLYSALHKLAMLNDLAIPKAARDRFKRDTKSRRFASRLPEPQDEDKVFRFEQVNFRSSGEGQIVDYVSLSDGEHQLVQILGTFCMVSFPNVVFLLDEPESHFNPRWRVNFISRVLGLRTAAGPREDPSSPASRQDVLLSTHAPFVASDMPRERVLIFSKSLETKKIAINRPDIQTYGSTFDAILEECFGVRPPISQMPRDDIAELMKSSNPDELRDGIKRLGHSVEKVFLADRLRQLTQEGEP